MIKGLGIHKSYEQLHVLKGVDIEIEKGELVAIVGKSGAGKSTLLHILGTLDDMDKGSLNLIGKELTGMNSKELAAFRNQNIGFVFQFHHLLPEFNAIENICIPAFINKRKKSTVEKEAMELLDYLGLKDRANHKPSELSGGEQQRVAIARALINKPQIIFADEPTGNLDTVTSQELHRLFKGLQADFGQTFVLVTHSEELAALSDRKLTMQDGCIINDELKLIHGK